MRYELRLPKDPHGQPLPQFRSNQRNNAAKAIDQLSGICSGILADGVVNEAEAKFFADWVESNATNQPGWPFTDIIERVRRIFSDGICDAEERDELRLVMQAICGVNEQPVSGETRSSALPLDEPQPDPIVFAESVFNITGRFAFGTRRKVSEAIEFRGGIAMDFPPTRDSG